MKPKISIIAAITPERVIGKKGEGMLWHIPEDLKHFKELTVGHPVIMGRKTYETLGKPLPNRTNIIITRDKSYTAPGCIVVYSLEEALRLATLVQDEPLKDSEVFIIGGGEIYEQAIGLADKLYLTLVHKDFEGDVYFPEYLEFKKEVRRQDGESAGGLKFTFLELERP